MRYALNSNEMRAAEARVVADGIATLGELMERAGAAVAAEVLRRRPEGPVVAVCGPGNNGGDGWVAARVLHLEGRDVSVLALRAPAELPAEARVAASRAVEAGVRYAISVPDSSRVATMLPGGTQGASATVVDAISGTGFRGPASGAVLSAIEAVNSSRAYVVSVDVPSGTDADTGAIAGLAVRADVTVTFGALKPGLLIHPGAASAGEVVVADIGIPDALLAAEGALELPDARSLSTVLPRVTPTDHKGSRGKVAIVAGSRSYAGAAVLAVRGALRMGAGYVVAVVPEVTADVLRLLVPNVIVREVPSDATGAVEGAAAVLDAVADADAVVVGPGLTVSPGVAGVVRALLAQVEVPLLLDADALNVCEGELALLAARKHPLVVTPHPGEAARLLGTDSAHVQSDRLSAAGRIAGEHAVCLLKGPGTIVARAGRRALVRAGNAGLARAGSGDVLAGMIGTLLAQGLAPFDAAVLGAHLHGRAAEHGTARLTETCFTASDITDFLPDAVRELAAG